MTEANENIILNNEPLLDRVIRQQKEEIQKLKEENERLKSALPVESYPKNWQFFKEDFIAYADRLLRDRGASSKDTWECLELVIDDFKEKYEIRFKDAPLPVESGWISVKDRKPQKAKPILIFNGNWIGVGWYKKHQDDKVKWSDETGEYIYPEPAFWRELPEPPK